MTKFNQLVIILRYRTTYLVKRNFKYMKPIDYTKTPELIVTTPSQCRLVYFFNLLLDDIFLKEIFRKINNYAFQVLVAF